MGTSRNAAEFSRKITNVATVTQRRSKEIVEQGALTGKAIILAEAAAKGVTPTSKIAGGRWGVRYDTKGFNNPTSLLRITGPFHLVEGDNKAHRINRRTARVKGRGSARANRQRALNEAFGARGAYTGGSLKFADGTYRKVAHHPGTKGKGIFKAAKVKIGTAVPVVMSQRLVGGWRSALR
jgi:hypothetical protein